MARGYWEAKDTHDDLDAEIQAKFNRGYPRDNILFEDSQTAVLIQNGNEAMRVDMSRPGELHRLIRRFLDYELPEIEEFRQARQQFKADLPAVLESLREAVADAEAGNSDYQDAAALFLNLCRQTISPDVSDADVREMLLQHILTRDIFLRVFAEDQFHRENNVARQLDALESTFFTGDARREAIDRLRVYYGAIGRAADEIADYAEKQQFLKAIYEDFYQAYNPAAADRLGVVYTPNEVVDFIIRGTDHLLQKHFGCTLADDNVQILDPATGTGTFITSLINHLPLDRLEHKYRNEIHANEVAILPYYIANLNIEYTYRERTGRYLEFPNLCFVDTLDNMDWQGAMLSAVTPDTLVPHHHIIRRIKPMVDKALARPSPAFYRVYAADGRASILPEHLLKVCRRQPSACANHETQPLGGTNPWSPADNPPAWPSAASSCSLVRDLIRISTFCKTPNAILEHLPASSVAKNGAKQRVLQISKRNSRVPSPNDHLRGIGQNSVFCKSANAIPECLPRTITYEESAKTACFANQQTQFQSAFPERSPTRNRPKQRVLQISVRSHLKPKTGHNPDVYFLSRNRGPKSIRPLSCPK